ncbi:MAG: DeoR/GlpR family DNA-binding transcription regulator [Verrucomicrobiota bacterium]|nr:DeoR/GlpR family DNA-binding transcription regulator [Verrucomicrobiota bacterium]
MSPRHQFILQQLQSTGEVAVKALAFQFEVTEMTIRRDLDEMERLGKCIRTHGGAMLSTQAVVEFAFSKNAVEHTEAKQAIAQCMAKLVPAGSSLVIDTGSTTLQVARAIAHHKNLRVLTSSLAIASTLFAHEGIELILLGGTVRKSSPDLTGPITEDALGRFTVDLAILGADAITQEGFYTTDIGVSRISQAMLATARKTYVVADSSKFTRQSFIRFAEWTDIHGVITDDIVPTDCLRWLKKTQVELHTASIGS